MLDLVAITSCHKNASYRDYQRQTWIPELESKFDYKFFMGKGNPSYQPQLDEVLLECPDDYQGLPAKVRDMAKWGVRNGYSHLFKCDDDAYLVPSRLSLCGYQSHQYMGRIRTPSAKWPASYAVGGPGYWLGNEAMAIIANAELTEDTVEDRWVGNALSEQGIEGWNHEGFVVVLSDTYPTPATNNNLISACELHGSKMLKAHETWLLGAKPSYILRPDKTRVFGNISGKE